MNSSYWSQELQRIRSQIQSCERNIEKTNDEIEELKKKIQCCENCNTVLGGLSGLSNVSSYLSSAQGSFANGGYVDGGTGLIDNEVNSVVSQIGDIIEDISKLSKTVNEKLIEYQKQLKEKEAHLKELQDKRSRLSQESQNAWANYQAALAAEAAAS